ncbi:MAG: hypothetical protein ACLP7F_24200 [Acidimicrobiales bacterium]
MSGSYSPFTELVETVVRFAPPMGRDHKRAVLTAFIFPEFPRASPAT